MQVLGFGYGFDFGWEGGTSPVYALDFITQTYNSNGTPYTLATLPGWSFARASIGTADDSLGVIHSFTSGQPRITDLGIEDETAYTELWAIANTNTAANQWPILSGATVSTGIVPARIAGAVTTKITTTGSSGRVQRNLSVVSDSSTYVFSVDIQKIAGNHDVTIGVVGGTGVTTSMRIDGLTGAILSGGPGIIVPKDANWWRVAVTVTNNSSAGNTTLAMSVNIAGASPQSGEVALPNVGIVPSGITSMLSYMPPGAGTNPTRLADAIILTYTPAGTSGTVQYAVSGSASISPTSPINLGASSGGAWVNNPVRSLVIQ